MNIRIDKILPNPEQPRKEFDQVELESLAASIRQDGVINPVTVEQAGDQFILHDGERRLRAVRIAGLSEIPAHVTPPLDGKGNLERLARALVANVQRSDLNPIEEARAYDRLKREFGFTINQIALRMGANPARISTRLALLDLDPEIQDLIARDEMGTDPRVIAAIKKITNKEARVGLAKKAASGNYKIREIIKAAQKVELALENRKKGAAGVGTPGLNLGLDKTRRTLDLPKWNALAQVGRIPPWDVVERSANKTCDRCSLRCMASADTCQECPLPVVLGNMINMAMDINLEISSRRDAR